MISATESYEALSSRHAREDFAVLRDLVGKVDSRGEVSLGRRRVPLSRVLFELGQEQRHAEELSARMVDPDFARDAFAQAMFEEEFDDSFPSHLMVLRRFYDCDFSACASVADLLAAAFGSDESLAGAYQAARKAVLSYRCAPAEA